MERVLSGLNPKDGPEDYVSVYIDDVIVFSRTLEEHLQHLCQVIQRISDAGLKLKPSKYHFILQEPWVEDQSKTYLGCCRISPTFLELDWSWAV